jgi:Domain of unknown function (DUF397)
MSDTYNWRKSSYSGQGNTCVEVARLAHGTAVRDSQDPCGPVLEFPVDAWQVFTSAVKDSRL